MPALVPPPQRSYGGAAVLASDHDRGVLARNLQRVDVDGRGRVGRRRFPRARSRRRRVLGLTVQDIEAGGLRDAVVVRRAAAAPLGAAGPIATTTSGAGARRHLIRRHIRRSGSTGERLARRRCLRCLFLGCLSRVHDDVRRALQVSRPRRIPGLEVQAARVADCGALGGSPPQRGPGRSAVAVMRTLGRCKGQTSAMIAPPQQMGLYLPAHLATLPLGGARPGHRPIVGCHIPRGTPPDGNGGRAEAACGCSGR